MSSVYRNTSASSSQSSSPGMVMVSTLWSPCLLPMWSGVLNVPRDVLELLDGLRALREGETLLGLSLDHRVVFDDHRSRDHLTVDEVVHTLDLRDREGVGLRVE